MINHAEAPEELVPLPTSAEGLDAFVAEIVTKFDLPNTDDTYESIATLILHMPQSSSSAPLSFFANSVNKSRANAVAYAKMQEFSEKRKAAHAAATASNQVDPYPAEQGSTGGQQSVQNSTVQAASSRVE